MLPSACALPRQAALCAGIESIERSARCARCFGWPALAIAAIERRPTDVARVHARRPRRMVVHAAAQAAAHLEPHLLELANDLAEAAARVTTSYFRTRVAVDVKVDASPVTAADREAEGVMRALLAARCPDHAVFGEEQGFSPGRSGSSRYMWVLDPIDGTKSFITGARRCAGRRPAGQRGAACPLLCSRRAALPHPDLSPPPRPRQPTHPRAHYSQASLCLAR